MSRTAVIRAYAAAMAAVLAFVSWNSFTEPLPTRKPDVQAKLFKQVPTALPGPPPVAAPAEEGEALFYMRVPRFGENWIWTVLEGIDLEDLARGPGHYPNTPLPGENGNSAIAGHRAGHGQPFIDFDRLRIGDEVILSQNGATWTYRLVTEPEVIEPDDRSVLRDYGGKTLTLTTCWPKYGSEKRMFVRGVLQAEE